jgi:hypothetical protein
LNNIETEIDRERDNVVYYYAYFTFTTHCLSFDGTIKKTEYFGQQFCTCVSPDNNYPHGSPEFNCNLTAKMETCRGSKTAGRHTYSIVGRNIQFSLLFRSDWTKYHLRYHPSLFKEKRNKLHILSKLTIYRSIEWYRDWEMVCESVWTGRRWTSIVSNDIRWLAIWDCKKNNHSLQYNKVHEIKWNQV